MVGTNIIFLNGVSSSGKTTIAKELQSILDSSYIHLSFDDFLKMAPQRFLEAEGIIWDETPLDNIIPQVTPPTTYYALASGFHHAVAAFAERGNNVIVDHVLKEKWWAVECQALFKPFNTIFVGVHCPIEQLEIREKERGDRPVGLARFQLKTVHLHITYQVEVDTYLNSPQECATKIWQYLAKA